MPTHNRQNRYNTGASYVPAHPPNSVRRMTPEEVSAIVQAVQGHSIAPGQEVIHVDASGAYHAREGILERTNAVDRALASIITLAPVLLFSGVLVWGLAVATGLPLNRAVILFALLTFAVYSIIHALNLAHSRPGIERLKIRSAERLERQRMRHAAQLQRQRQQHEKELADKAMDTYYRALLERTRADD